MGAPMGMETRELGWARPITLDSRAADNKSGAGCGRLKAASDPTGHEQGEEQNSVAWLREQQYFSRRVWAGSAPAEALSESARARWNFGVERRVGFGCAPWSSGMKMTTRFAICSLRL